MAELECALTELPVSMCAHCRGIEPEPEPELLVWFTAQYAGICAECGKAIDCGDDIAKTEDGYICRRRHDG